MCTFNTACTVHFEIGLNVQYVLVKIRWIFSATGGAWKDCPHNCLLNISKSCRDVSQGLKKNNKEKKNVHKTKSGVNFLHSSNLRFTQLCLCHEVLMASSSSSFSASMYGIFRSSKHPFGGLLVGQELSWQGTNSTSISAWATSGDFTARLCFWCLDNAFAAKRNMRLA